MMVFCGRAPSWLLQRVCGNVQDSRTPSLFVYPRSESPPLGYILNYTTWEQEYIFGHKKRKRIIEQTFE